MKTLTQSLKILSLAMMVLFFSNCTKDSDDIVPDTTQNQGTNNGNTNNTGTDNTGTDTTPTTPNPVDELFDDSVSYDGDVLIGDWTIDSMGYSLEEDGATTDANGSGTIKFNADGTGSRSYVYTSSVLDEGSYYTVDEEFEWRRYTIEATDDTPEIQKVQLRGANDVTWTEVESSNDEVTFSFVAIPNNVTHYYEVTFTSGLPENHLVGDWNIDAMSFEVTDGSASGNSNPEGSITFNEDGTGSRLYTFQSHATEGDDTHKTEDEFTWWLVGQDKIKIDNGNWVETWNRMEDEANMQKATVLLGMGGLVQEFTVTLGK